MFLVTALLFFFFTQLNDLITFYSHLLQKKKH